jgi:uncharacterized membrane protein
MRSALAVAGGLVRVLAAGPAACTALFTGIGDLPGGRYESEIHAVSGDGTTVVGSSSVDSRSTAFRWQRDTGLSALGGVLAGSTRAFDVSDDGSVIVGELHSCTRNLGAFRWRADGDTADVQLLVFHDPPETSYTRVSAVSGDGSRLLGQILDYDTHAAWTWTETEGLRYVVENSAVELVALSDDGSVMAGRDLGYDTSSPYPYPIPEAVRWTSQDGLERLAEAPAPKVGFAHAITPDGTTIVGTIVGPTGLALEMMRWTSETGLQLLGNEVSGGPSDAHSAVATSLSDDASFLVGHARYGDLNDTIAILWDEIHGLRDPKTLLQTDYGLDLSGWSLEDAVDISGDGRVIVGNGTNPAGQREGWVVVIPEPASGHCSASGCSCCARGARSVRRRGAVARAVQSAVARTTPEAPPETPRAQAASPTRSLAAGPLPDSDQR